MLIESVGGKNLINWNNVERISISGKSNNIVAFHRGDYTSLGQYESEEECKEIIQLIKKAVLSGHIYFKMPKSIEELNTNKQKDIPEKPDLCLRTCLGR